VNGQLRLALLVAVVLATVVAVAGCSARDEGSATRRTPLTKQLASARGGIALRYPAGWDGALVGPNDVFVVASFPLPHGRLLDYPLDRVRRRLPEGGALVQVFQYPRLLEDPAYRKNFPPRPARLRLERKDFASYEGWGPGYLLRFRQRGHAVQIMVALGERASPETPATLLRILDSIQVEPTTVEIRTIALPGAPREVAVGLGAVWVVAERPGATEAAILRIEPRTRRIVATIRAPGRSVIGGLAVGEGAVWATDLNLGKVLRIDPATNRIAARIALPLAPFRPFAIAAGEGGIWVTVPTNVKGAVVRIDPQTNRAGSPIEVGYGPDAVTAAAGAVWVTNTNVAGGSLMRVDPKTGRVVAKLLAGRNPGAVAASRRAVWAAFEAGASIARIDPASNRLLASIPASDGVGDLAAGLGSIWFTNACGCDDGRVKSLDPRTVRVGLPIPVGTRPIALAAGEGAVWIANYTDQTLTKIVVEPTAR
jgi:virginiamycin B lyase